MTYTILRAAIFTVFTVFAAVATQAQMGMAKVQVIHNAADPSASLVDIYVGTQKALDNFAFRTASPFVELPAGVPLAIGVAPASSMTVAEALGTFTVTLEAGGTYLAIANGVLNDTTFVPNPGGASIEFTIIPVANARTKGDSASAVDVRVFHGVTDVGQVDVYAGDTKLLSNVGYGQSSNYLTIPPVSYVLGIAPAGAQPIARFTADLSDLRGQATTVLASGFLDPAKNKDGKSFGLFAVLSAGGAFRELPAVIETTKARVRIVHNAADPAAAKVDLYVDGVLTADDFAFRTTTPTLELEAGKPYAIGVALSTSTSAADTIASFNVALPEGNYVVFANGVVQTDFAPNPSGAKTAFAIYPIANVRTQATAPNVDLLVFHGVTDAPAVDVRVAGSNIVSALEYGKTSEYVSVPAGNYVVDVAPAGGAVLKSYSVPAADLAGQVAVVFASGFLNPEANRTGPAFGLFALIGGSVIQLPEATTSVLEVLELGDASVVPNPTTSDITARFTMPVEGSVSIRVFDLSGTLVSTSTIGNLVSGSHAIPVAANALASGSYMMLIDATTHRSAIPFSVVR